MSFCLKRRWDAVSDRAIKRGVGRCLRMQIISISRICTLLRASRSPGILAAKDVVNRKNRTLIYQRFAAFMKVLASVISKELKNAKHCAVYEPELTRVWPDPDKREMQIASFAKKHG